VAYCSNSISISIHINWHSKMSVCKHLSFLLLHWNNMTQLPCGVCKSCCSSSKEVLCHAMAKVVSHWPVTTETGVWSQASPCGICGWQSDTGTWFMPSTSVFLCHYHSTNVPYLFIHLSWPQYN
jgi:hypothetical protein